MAKDYITLDGDRLDLICNKYYGSVEHVEAVLSANYGLAEAGPVYSAGIKITLPDFDVVTFVESVSLWS